MKESRIAKQIDYEYRKKKEAEKKLERIKKMNEKKGK